MMSSSSVIDERIDGISDQKATSSPQKINPSPCSELTHNKKKTASYFNVLFSGFALLSDGYQSGVISFINLFLGKIYGDSVFNTDMKSRLSYAMFVGAIVGQLGKKREKNIYTIYNCV